LISHLQASKEGFGLVREQSQASSPSHPNKAGVSSFNMFGPAFEYLVDAAQRSVLFWDVMRQRGDQYREHLAETAPHVLPGADHPA
jgi:hypothetical protein